MLFKISKLLISIFAFALPNFTNAQRISVVDNVFPRSEIANGRPAINGNNLYFGYGRLGGILTCGSTGFAMYNDTVITILEPLLDGCSDYRTFFNSPFFYNNKLYGVFSYSNNGKSVFLLGKYENGYSFFNNPDSGIGVNEDAIVYKNKMYFSYNDKANKCRLAQFDGTSTTLIPNPDSLDLGLAATDQGFIIYNGNLYFIYIVNDNKLQLAKFDGNQITLIDNPDQGLGVYDDDPSENYLLIHNGILYLGYYNELNILQLAKYNGTSISLVDNPDASDVGYLSNLIVFNNTLCGVYANASGGYQLAKYDGANLSLVDNPNAEDPGFISGNPIIYNSNLYGIYWNENGQYQLAKYNGTVLSVIDNPDNVNNISFNLEPFVHLNNLYYGYEVSGKDHLIKYDGTNLNVIANPDDGRGYKGFPILYNNKMFFCYEDSSYLNHLAFLDTRTLYTFTGNGNWDVPSNWSNNLIPPSTLIGDSKIVITPTVGGECILNINQIISSGTIVEVSANAKFRIIGDLRIQK